VIIDFTSFSMQESAMQQIFQASAAIQNAMNKNFFVNRMRECAEREREKLFLNRFEGDKGLFNAITFWRFKKSGLRISMTVSFGHSV
jgi:hypothetical protein